MGVNIDGINNCHRATQSKSNSDMRIRILDAHARLAPIVTVAL